MRSTPRTLGFALTCSLSLAHAAPTTEPDPCEPECPKACCLDLEALIGGFQPPELWIGSEAPPLELTADLRTGEAVTLQRDTLHIIEFWATWCGPCIAQFPHLSELQQHYEDDLRVISVNLWDEQEGETREDRLTRVSTFVEGQGDRMRYAVAMEATDKAAFLGWMHPAGLNGIPAAFIVDSSGRIAWIGHPKDLDRPVEALVSGDADLEALEAEARHRAIVKRAKLDFWTGVHDPEADPERVFTLGRAIAHQQVWDDALGLNGLAWPLVLSDSAAHRNDTLALEFTTRAAEIASGDEGYVVYDTHAVALYRNGQVEQAIEFQRRALEGVHNHEAADMMRAQMERRLREMEQAAG